MRVRASGGGGWRELLKVALARGALALICRVEPRENFKRTACTTIQ